MAEVVDPTSGLNPVIGEPYERTINGRLFRLKGLGIKDTFAAIRIGKQTTAQGAREGLFHMGMLGGFLGQWQGTFSPALIAQLFNQGRDFFTKLAPILGLPEMEDALLQWLAAHVQVKEEDGKWGPVSQASLEDPDIFPMDSVIDLGLMLAHHPSLHTFFNRLPELANDPLALAAFKYLTPKPIDTGSEPSIPSNGDTPGSPTNGSPETMDASLSATPVSAN